MSSEKLVSIDESVFQKLQPEIQIAIKLNGDIIYKNTTAKLIFPLTNIYDHFIEHMKQEFFTFCQKLTMSGTITSKRIAYKNKQLLFKGVLEGELIYLTIYHEESYQSEANKLLQVFNWGWDSLHIGVLGIDVNDQIMGCNGPCIDFLGLNHGEQVIGKSYKVQLRDSQLIDLIIDINSEIRTREKTIQRYFFDQEVFYLLQAFYYEADESVYFFISDHTYLQKFENLLLYKEQMEQVSHLAAGVAHEIRNPLSVIKGFIQLANHTKKFDHFYDTVMSEINRMNDIIEDFLAVSKKRDYKRGKFKPHDIIKSNISIMQSECLLHGIDLQYHFDSEEGHLVDVNDGRIKQVILNLLRNAIEAFQDSTEMNNKQIIVNGYHNHDFYQVEFIDNGPGMDADILKELGKPFFTTKEKGTGIGITMCKKIIQDHGGKFTIDSTVGRGTTIRFTLPYAK